MKYIELIKALSPLIGVILGAFIGYALDICKNNKKRNADYNMAIIDMYKEISSEIIETISPLASLSLRHRSFTSEQLDEWRKKISELYFKHYTYLPQSVLNEMNCLHSCIQTGGKKLYCVKNGNEIKPCEKEDVVDLFDDTALVGGERERIKDLVETYSVDRLSESLKINLQARRVIRVVAAIFENSTINEWNTMLKKETLLQMRSRNVENKK